MTFSRQKKWEREFQVETRTCANPRDKKDHGMKALGMVSFSIFGFFGLLFYMTPEKVAGKKERKRSGKVQV